MEKETKKISKRARMQVRYNSLLLQSTFHFHKEPVREKLLSKLTRKVIKKKKDGKEQAIREIKNNIYWKLRKKQNMSKEVGTCYGN